MERLFGQEVGDCPVLARIVLKCREIKVIGIDYWGKGREYSKGMCEENARLEGVGDRTLFQKDKRAA